MTSKPLLSLSIIVHNQEAIARHLLDDIDSLGDQLPLEVLFTANTNESLSFGPGDFRFPLKLIRNTRPKGFGANHNSAFKLSRGDFFSALNPDIRLVANPFPPLIACLNDGAGGVAAPRIVNPRGDIENSARRFPTPLHILQKAAKKSSHLDYPPIDAVYEPDWIGGMFMLFHRRSFDAVQGFDERYFLYYEDVDICARLRMKGLSVLLCPEACAIHDARWDSHRNLKYMRWHLTSMLRYFASPGFRKLVVKPALRG
jgi:GT2 family glycosyltransferase